jgi:DNA-directed RNA polymerase subunit M/transcription elongation factor TFIIS
MNERSNINNRNKSLDKIKIKDDIFCDCGKLLKKYRYENSVYLYCDCGGIYLPSEKILKIFNGSNQKSQKSNSSLARKYEDTSGMPFFCEACNQETTAKTIVIPPRYGDESNLIIIICNKCNKVYREGNEY